MKSKSLYVKLFTLIMVIFLVSSVLLGIMSFGFLGSYFTEKNEKNLKNVAKEVTHITLTLASNRSSAQAYRLSIESIASATDTQIFIVDNQNNLVISSIKGYNGRIKEKFTQGMLSGKSEVFRGKIDADTSAVMLAVSEPIVYSDEVVGGVLVSVPLPQITKTRSEVFEYFFWSICIAIVFVAVLVYFLARKITKPLLKLNAVARSISNGNFKERVEIDDIEELAQLGETFNDMAESIETLEATRNSFIANITHDLRTPMTTITGFVEGILDGTIPKEKHEWYLSIVLDESKRLSRIVNDLLDISKLEQGSFSLEMQDFDLNELTRLNIIKFEKNITDKNIQLSVEFEKNSIMVNADKDAISRVLTNLFDNAIKFTNENGFIDIKVGEKDKKAYVSVQNSGLGIAEEERVHIFDRFYKTDKSRSLDKNGAGLGLYIVKNIIQAHGQRVWAESKQGEFARFSFTVALSDNKKQITEGK